MKKLYTLLILILMIASLLSSCKKEENIDPNCGVILDIYITNRIPQGPTWTINRRLETGSIDVDYVTIPTVVQYEVGDRMCIYENQ